MIVKATIDGKTYELAYNQYNGRYEKEVDVPEGAIPGMLYNVEIKATDDAGNSTQADSATSVLGKVPELIIDSNHDETDSGRILTNALGIYMLDMIAPVYFRSRFVLYLFNAFGIVLSKEADFILNDFISQIFIQTATWGLDYWEKEYGVTPDSGWTIRQRRDNLMSMFQYEAPITPKKIENRITAMLGIPATVRESRTDHTLYISINGYTSDYDKVMKMFDKIIPAHLYYEVDVFDIVDSMATEYTAILQSECEIFDVKILN